MIMIMIIIYDYIIDHNLDMVGLCETWLTANDEQPLIAASPPNFIFSQSARTTKKGGGVALIHNPKYSLNQKSHSHFSSFELLLMSSLPSQNAPPPFT